MAAVRPRVRRARVLQPHDPVVGVRRMERLEPEVRGVRVPPDREQASIAVSNPGHLETKLLSNHIAGGRNGTGMSLLAVPFTYYVEVFSRKKMPHFLLTVSQDTTMKC